MGRRGRGTERSAKVEWTETLLAQGPQKYATLSVRRHQHLPSLSLSLSRTHCVVHARWPADWPTVCLALMCHFGTSFVCTVCCYPIIVWLGYDRAVISYLFLISSSLFLVWHSLLQGIQLVDSVAEFRIITVALVARQSLINKMHKNKNKATTWVKVKGPKKKAQKNTTQKHYDNNKNSSKAEKKAQTARWKSNCLAHREDPWVFFKQLLFLLLQLMLLLLMMLTKSVTKSVQWVVG